MRKPSEEGRVPLKRCEPHEAKETLGIFMAMDGNQDEEITQLRKKAEAFAERVRSAAGLERNDVWEAMVTQMMATLQYPAAATQITNDDWKHIMTPMLHGALPRAGINRYFPRDVLFGPLKFQGMGLMHPFHYQEMEHLEIILRHCTEDSFLGKQLQMSWEALTLETGLPGNFTSWDYATWSGCTTDCWLKTVWKYCQDENIRIEDPFGKPDLAREGDEFIMQAFADCNDVDEADLCTLNQCRTFLHAVTKADICTADGKRLLRGVLEGKKPAQRAHSYEWPRQPTRLSKHHWDTWNKAITACFLQPYSATQELKEPMTDWFPSAVKAWPWHYWQAGKKLYEKDGSRWHVYEPRRGGGRTGSTYHHTGETNELPTSCRPAAVTPHPGSPLMVKLQSFSTHRSPDRSPTDDEPSHVHGFRKWLPDTELPEGWAVEVIHQRTKHTDNAANVAQAMQDGTCKAIIYM